MIRARRLAAQLEAEITAPLPVDDRHWFRRASAAGMVADDLAITQQPECAKHPLVAEAIRLRARLLKIKHHACGRFSRDLTSKDLNEIREY